MPESDMDPKKAFNILGLETKATLEEAKAGYRAMAKLWHPDRFGHDPELGKAAESKMKALNDAFVTVSKIVKPGKHQEKKAGSSKTVGNPPPRKPRMSPSKAMADWLTKIARRGSKRSGPRPAKPRHTKKKVSVSKPGNRHFDTVLNRTVSRGNRSGGYKNMGTLKKRGRRVKPKGVAPDYRSYMVLKRKIQRKRRFMDADPGPIEKIRPVSRVPGIGDE